MSHNNTNKNYGFPLAVIGSLFFVFGFITWSTSQLIPYFKIACELTDVQSYLVTSAFFAAYFVMGLPSSAILHITGYKKGMSLGLLIMAIGALVFLPAATLRNYYLFLLGLFIIGTGMALLQTASNPYAAILGSKETAGSRIAIMGLCNKVAGIIAVYALGSIALKDVDALTARLELLSPVEKNLALDELIGKIYNPALLLAVALMILAALIYKVKLPEVNEEDAAETATNNTDKNKGIGQFRHLWLGVVAIFCYVGVEVISYDTFPGFGVAMGYSLDTAKAFPSYTGYALIVGYLLGLVVTPKYISQRKALYLSALLSILLVIVAVLTSGTTAMVAFALLGLSNAMIWPSIWPLALDGLGRFTKTGSALLIMGILGGAVLPPLYAQVATLMKTIGMERPQQVAYLFVIPFYLYIIYYALKGYRPKTRN